MTQEIYAEDYESPRWTGEILDCSMPVTLDTNSMCEFDCQYCFAFFQKTHACKGYNERRLRYVRPDKIRALFTNALNGQTEGNVTLEQFGPYIRDRKVMQWGALSDPFDPNETRHRRSLELLRFFDEIDYPLSISTKGVNWTKDPEYMDLFSRHQHNWHVKVSIIGGDAEKCRIVEKGCPSPAQRIEAIRRLSDLGVKATLRYRPYIIGVSDDFRDVFQEAADAGAFSVSAEFFCMESRADARTKERYAEIGRAAGYNVYDFYIMHSRQHGYKRLNESIKRPIMVRMLDEAHRLGMKFHVSDAFCRDLNDDGINCCGVPDDWNSCKDHFGGAIMIGKEKGEVRWGDIGPGVQAMFGHFFWQRAHQFNTSNNLRRAQFCRASMADWIRWQWNSPKNGVSPAKMYGRLLRPVRRDGDGNVVYKYVGQR